MADDTVASKSGTDSQTPMDENENIKTEKSEIEEQEEPTRKIRGIKWLLVVASILTTTFIFGLDNTIVAVIQPAVVNQFSSIDRLPWLATTYLMCAGSTCLFWSQMYGQIETKRLYISCIIVFEAGSAICGAAPNMAALIIGRAITGVGGMGMYTGVLTLFSTLAEPREKSVYFGLAGLIWGCGTVLGPIIGGAFTSSSAGWRWSFYINLVIAGVCAPIYIFLIPTIRPRPGVSIKERLSKIDFIGLVLLCGSYPSLLMAISFGGVMFEWGSPRNIALFVVAGVLSIAFFIQQLVPIGVTKQIRSFPFQFLRNRVLSITFVLECCSATLCYITIYFIPLYFQFVRSNTALIAGAKTLPLVASLVSVVVLNGFVLERSGRYMPWFLAGGILGLIGGATLYNIDLSTTDAKVYGYSILIGAGTGCYIQLPFSVSQFQVKPEDIPKAIGYITFAQQGAPSVMLGIVNAAFLNEASNKILANIPGLEKGSVLSILSGVGGSTFASRSMEEQQAILGFILSGLSQGYIATMVASSLTIILSLFLPRGKLWE